MRRLILAVVVAALVLVFGVTALLAADSATAGGSLSASGTGKSTVRLMSGTVVITGEGTLWVSEQATVKILGTPGTKTKQAAPRGPGHGRPGGPDGGPADANQSGAGGQQRGGPREGGGPGDGQRREPPMGFLYTGFKGKATISGEKVMVMLESRKSQTLAASGNGMAMLVGTGSYTATSKRGTDKGSWVAQPKGAHGQQGAQRPQPPKPVIFGEMSVPGRGPGGGGMGR